VEVLTTLANTLKPEIFSGVGLHAPGAGVFELGDPLHPAAIKLTTTASAVTKIPLVYFISSDYSACLRRRMPDLTRGRAFILNKD